MNPRKSFSFGGDSCLGESAIPKELPAAHDWE